jgi:hypothetical protein
MNRVKYWEIIYNSVEQPCIEKMLKGLYGVKDWEELHVALWTWLSLDGKRRIKAEWFEKFNVPKVVSLCFACEVAAAIDITYMCLSCPMERDKDGQCANGLYEEWSFSRKIADREKLAREIANLEWNIK